MDERVLFRRARAEESKGKKVRSMWLDEKRIEDGVVIPQQLECVLRLVGLVPSVERQAHLDLGLEGVEPAAGVRAQEGNVRLDATLLQRSKGRPKAGSSQ